MEVGGRDSQTLGACARPWFDEGMARPFLVFDLDGTLSDPALGIGRCLNHALAAYGYRTIPEPEFGSCVGPGLDVSFRKVAGELAEDRVRELVAKYRERYGSVGFKENVLYPGIPEALASLSERGVPMGLCTTKRADFAERILEHFGLRHHFAFISGGDMGIPKADQLRDLLAAGAIGRDATMIGDRDLDIVAGKAHGLRTVGVLWGHGGREELQTAEADLLVAEPRELLGMHPGSVGF